LGIILANKADSKGTVVSGVRTSSVLAEKISPGDRIIAIDSEDVSRMTVSEITTIMARKGDFERMLTVLTVPKQQQQSMPTTSSIASESEAGSMMNSSIVLYGTHAPCRR
jgi:C-terminal processing protease CtpA/Prc